VEAFDALLLSFGVQTLSGIVAVFVGIWLALVVERRRHAEDLEERDADQMREYERATETILGSVVKNTAEAKRILRLLESPATAADRLIHCGLETAVWHASQDQFIAHCRNVDQRVIFAQFFDNVRRLQAFIGFRGNLVVSATTARLDAGDAPLQALVADVDRQLATLAEDLRFCGVILVTDHGKPVHKRLMGIRTDGAAPSAQPSRRWTDRARGPLARRKEDGGLRRVRR
jgi:hypothetical protein